MQQPTSVPAPERFPLIEVDFILNDVTWHLTAAGNPDERYTATVPWFAGIGVLDYADAEPRTHHQPDVTSVGTFPAYGDPLIVRPDLAAVFWRVGSVLHTAPIRRRRVDFTAAAAIGWTAARAGRDELVAIEHNLAQCSTLPTLDPPLHVVQADMTGRLSLALLLADRDSSPVIGPATHHYPPSAWPGHVRMLAEHGPAALAAVWERQLTRSSEDGTWRLVPPTQAVQTLAASGFTVTGAAADRPGLVAAFNAAGDSQWAPGWYGGTRVLALARFRRQPNTGDRHYDYHEPGSRKVAGVYENGEELLGWHGPADVETLPPTQPVRVQLGYPGGARSLPIHAGHVALHEPVLIRGTIPVIDHEVSWTATCRRCDTALNSGAVGRFDFVPYVHELTPDPGVSLWCPDHPRTDRRRPHAPVCEVTQRPST